MLYQYHADYWELYHKITVDYKNKLIIVNDGVTDLDIKVDVYSDLKEVWMLDPIAYAYSKYKLPIRTTGGDPTVDGEFSGDIYFLQYGWKLVYDPRYTKVTGVLFSDDYDTAFYLYDTIEPIYPTRVSSIVNTVSTGGTGTGTSAQEVWEYGSRTLTTASGPTAPEIADAVWNEAYVDHDTDGTMGHMVNYIHLMNKEIWVDTDAVTNGIGSQEHPFNNITSAIDRAEADGIKNIKIAGDIVLDRNLKNFNIIGIGLPEIDCNDNNIAGTHFSEIKFKGGYTAPQGGVIVRDSLLLENASLNGFFENCALAGNVFCQDGAEVFMKNVASAIPGTGRPTISMAAGGTSFLSIRGYHGGLTVKDCDNVADRVTVELDAGSLTYDSSCTSGVMVARGVGKFVDETSGATVVDETLNRESLAVSVEVPPGFEDAVSDAVWNKLLVDMVTAGSAGERMNALLTVNKYLALS